MTNTSVALDYKGLRQLKPYIRGYMAGTIPSQPNVVELILEECPEVDTIMQGCLYTSGYEDCVTGYLELIEDNVADAMRFLSRESEQFMCVTTDDLKVNPWKYLTGSYKVSTSNEVQNLVLRENYDGYVLTYRVPDTRWIATVKKIRDRYPEIVKQWSKFVVDKTPIRKHNQTIGIYIGNGVEVRFDDPDVFARVIRGKDQVVDYPSMEEFFFAMEEYLK